MKLHIHLVVEHLESQTKYKFEETLVFENKEDLNNKIFNWIAQKKQFVSDEVGVDFWSLAWKMEGTPVL